MLFIKGILCFLHQFVELIFNVLKTFAKVILKSVKISKAFKINFLRHVVHELPLFGRDSLHFSVIKDFAVIWRWR